jgi:multidrug efflux system outer membrane protein
MQKNYPVFLCAVGLIFLTGACRVGKNYTRPALDLPVQYRDAAGTDTVSIASQPWRTFFTDSTLRQIIDSAIAKNFDLQIAIKNIESAQQRLRQARLGNWPDVNALVTVGTTRPADNSLNGLSTSQFLGTSHVEDYNASLGLSWEIGIWGKIRMQKEAALANYLQTTEAKKAVQTQLVSTIAQGFYSLLTLDAQLKVAKENLALNDSTLRIIRLQYDAGQVTALAIEQADAQRQAAALLVPQLEQGIHIQENALRILSGELPSTIIRNTTLNEFEVNDNYATGVPAGMISLRPDVQANEMALRAANARVGIAQAEMYPSLVITASGGVNSFKVSNWFSIPASLFGMGAASLTQPIFQRRQLKTQYELAKIDRERSVVEFRQSVLTAVGEVSDALIKVQKLKTQREIASGRTNTLQNAIHDADLLFRNGMATYLEVITAQANVLQSELELADLKRQHLNSMVDLYRSLGGGWK